MPLSMIEAVTKGMLTSKNTSIKENEADNTAFFLYCLIQLSKVLSNQIPPTTVYRYFHLYNY